MPDEICYVCGDEVDEENDYCAGCDQYICEACDGVLPPDPHDPDIHAMNAATDALATEDAVRRYDD